MPRFETPISSNVKMKIALNSSGNIADDSQTIYSTKFFTIAGISATADLDDVQIVFDTFLGESLGGGRYDEYSAVRTITQKVI